MKMNANARIKLILAGIFFVACAGLSVSVAFLLQRAVDAAGAGDLNRLLTVLGVAFVIVVPVQFLSDMLGTRSRLSFTRNMLLAVKQSRMNFLFFRRTKAPADDDNKDLSFFSADADIMEQSYFNNRAVLPLHIATFVFALGSMLWINWIVTVVAIAITMLPLGVSSLFAGGLSKRKKSYSDAASSYVDTVRECIQGKKEIVAYDKQDIFMARHDQSNVVVENARYKSNFFEFMAGAVPGYMGGLVQITIMGLSSYFVITGALTFGYMIAIVQLMNHLFNPMGQFITALNGMRSAKAVLEKAQEAAPPEGSKTSVSDFDNEIELKNLGLKYNDDDDYVIQNLNLTFKRGGKYAIFAPSGYGKSSIAKAMAMEFAEFDGAITLDGRDIREIAIRDYNKILRFVRQDPYLFSDTALNNLAFFDTPPSKEELDNVLEITRVKDFLVDDEALSRYISNTSGLSGGQKQRIVLARALLHKPKILVMDEITSGVDLETACSILSDLFQDNDLTCIAITHENDERFLGLFDEIVRLGNGNGNGASATVSI